MKAFSWPLEGLRLFAKRGWRASCAAHLLQGGLRIVAPRGKRILSNLAFVYPESTGAWRKDIRRRIYENLAWTVTELMALQRDPAQALEWVEETQNRHFIEELPAPGKGVVLLTAHYGNWELLASWYEQFWRAKGVDNFYAIAQKVKDKDINGLIARYRGNSGVKTLPKETSTLEMVKRLKAGAHIATLADVSWGGGLVASFMGRPCTNSTGPAVLSLLSGVPIVPIGIYRKAPFRHKVVFYPPLQVPEGSEKADRRTKIELLTRAANTALENIIEPQPELWFWLHNRWKQPEP